MRRLVLILVSCAAAGCATSQAVNPHRSGTPEYVRWQDDRNLRQARRGFMFEGHESGVIAKEPSPSSIFPGQYWGRE